VVQAPNLVVLKEQDSGLAFVLKFLLVLRRCLGVCGYTICDAWQIDFVLGQTDTVIANNVANHIGEGRFYNDLLLHLLLLFLDFLSDHQGIVLKKLKLGKLPFWHLLRPRSPGSVCEHLLAPSLSSVMRHPKFC